MYTQFDEKNLLPQKMVNVVMIYLALKNKFGTDKIYKLYLRQKKKSKKMKGIIKIAHS